MTLISIRETGRTDDDFAATLSFDNQGEYPIVIRPPFSQQEEERLEWYFERYLLFPFVRQVEFQAAASSIPTYGQALFKQVFADSDAYAVCGNRYYTAETLKRVQAIATGKLAPERTEQVPVSHAQ